MIGLGTIINSGGIVLGGVIDSFAGKLFKPVQREPGISGCIWKHTPI